MQLTSNQFQIVHQNRSCQTFRLRPDCRRDGHTSRPTAAAELVVVPSVVLVLDALLDGGRLRRRRQTALVQHVRPRVAAVLTRHGDAQALQRRVAPALGRMHCVVRRLPRLPRQPQSPLGHGHTPSHRQGAVTLPVTVRARSHSLSPSGHSHTVTVRARSHCHRQGTVTLTVTVRAQSHFQSPSGHGHTVTVRTRSHSQSPSGRSHTPSHRQGTVTLSPSGHGHTVTVRARSHLLSPSGHGNTPSHRRAKHGHTVNSFMPIT